MQKIVTIITGIGFVLIGIAGLCINKKLQEHEIVINEIIHCDTLNWKSNTHMFQTIYDKMKPLYHKDSVNTDRIHKLYKLTHHAE